MQKLMLAGIFVLMVGHGILVAEEYEVGPRIIDATLVPVSQFPTVGKVGRSINPNICTGTLIAPRFVLTAAHCCVNDGTGQVAFKQDEGRFTLNGEVYSTKHIYVHPKYHGLDSVSIEGVVDLAIYELDREVVGVTPSPLNDVPPTVGTMLTLAGFGSLGTGTTGANRTFPPDGMIGTGKTRIDKMTPTYVEWKFDKVKPPNQESDTGPGDSGGPQFITVNGTMIVASVTSGGFSPNAKFGDLAFNTRVDIALPWIKDIVGGVQVPNNTAPVIQSASVDPPTALPDQTVTFSAAAFDVDGDALNYNWFFGDGTEIQNGTTSHTHVYSVPGNYVVQLVVTDGKGGSVSTSYVLQVAQTTPPVQTLSFSKKKFKVDFKTQTATMTVAMQTPMLIYASSSDFKNAYPDGSVVSVYAGNVLLQSFGLVGLKSKAGAYDTVVLDWRKGTALFQTKASATLARVLMDAGVANATTTGIVELPMRLQIKDLRGAGKAEYFYKAKQSVSANGKRR